MCEDKKIEATIQVSIGTCKKYVEDWPLFCKDVGISATINCKDTQLQLSLEQAKTHGII